MTTQDSPRTAPGRGKGAAGSGAAGTAGAADPRRWYALVVIALAQLMVALDATIVSIALPSAQADLGASDAGRQWVITAYTLAFGGLLLLGGRLADYAGRRRTFLVGLVGFAASSALGGAAQDFGTLVAARGLQGAFGALLAPSALSLLAVTFTDGRERGKAFGIYGAIAGSGGALGLVLGGLLTDSLSWRWCLFVNVPVAVVTVLGARALLPRGGGTGLRGLDLPGAVLATAGLTAVVFGCAQAAPWGWDSAGVLGSLAAGALLLAGFAVRQARFAQPLLPLWVLRDRSRTAAYLAVALTVAGMFGVFLFLTYDLQVVLAYSPVRAGTALLPLSGTVLVSSSGLASRMLPRVGPRVLMVPGLAVTAVALLMLSRLTVDSGYVAQVLPAEIVLGAGLGCVFVPAFNVATTGVGPREAGIASAVVNTSQQVGASVGTALLNTVATSATAAYAASHVGASRVEALVHGFSTGALVAAGLLAAAAVLAFVLLERPGDSA